MEGILNDILKELKRQKKYPFPDHICAQAGTVTNAAGKIMNASLMAKYGKEEKEASKQMAKQAAIRTAANAIRFLENLK